jgi:hypothetical protein
MPGPGTSPIAGRNDGSRPPVIRKGLSKKRERPERQSGFSPIIISLHRKTEKMADFRGFAEMKLASILLYNSD